MTKGRAAARPFCFERLALWTSLAVYADNGVDAPVRRLCYDCAQDVGQWPEQVAGGAVVNHAGRLARPGIGHVIQRDADVAIT